MKMPKITRRQALVSSLQSAVACAFGSSSAPVRAASEVQPRDYQSALAHLRGAMRQAGIGEEKS